MEVPQDAVLLRIFIGEADRWQRRPLYEAIVLKAREAASCRRDCVARTDGFRQVEPHAYGKNSSAFNGPAGRDRNRR